MDKDATEFPHIETARLLLRQITFDDAEAVLTHFSDAEMLTYIDFEPLTCKIQAEGVISWGTNIYTTGEGILWGIVEKQTNAFIGTINYLKKKEDDAAHRAEITYDLAKQYWGRGFMPEAIQATLPYVFEVMGITRIETTVHVQNFQSALVLIKSGFHMEGVLRKYKWFHGVLCDVMVFSLLNQDWQAFLEGQPIL